MDFLNVLALIGGLSLLAMIIGGAIYFFGGKENDNADNGSGTGQPNNDGSGGPHEH